MHIAEGMLSGPVLLTGAAVTATGVAIGLRRMDYERLPRVALLSSAFFVASLIHIPIGPSSVHLVLNGLAGVVLGWAAFPALLVAMLLQSVMFSFGGLTALGVNVAAMALPAVAVRGLLGRGVRSQRAPTAFVSGFAAGALAIALSALLIALALYLSNRRAFLSLIHAALLAHVPVMLIEGLVTGSAVGFLSKVKPEVLEPGEEPVLLTEAAHAETVP